jgi:D-sedoheptulose 7-phosphate isomerase
MSDSGGPSGPAAQPPGADRPGAADLLRQRIGDSLATTQALLDAERLATAGALIDAVVDAVAAGRTVFFFGNGGSSADAQHLAAELLGRFYRDRTALPSVSLADNVAAVTAIANDYAYEEIFSRQLRGLGRPGDVAVGLTTSGNSMNVIRALEVARELGLLTVAFTGAGGGKAAEVADHVFRAPSTDTPRIQEAHQLVGHTLCEAVEARLFPDA